MDLISDFLANPIVSLIGYVLSIIAAYIAIFQYLGKARALESVNKLKIEINDLKTINNIGSVTNKNEVNQGKKSQYFQDNLGSVNIDNRG